MLFDEKPLERIEYAEIAEFLELKIREGLRLDYKASYTDGIVATACAFANTDGGAIIVGAGENGQDQPDPALINGVELKEKRRVRDMITGHTRPPIMPEIQERQLPHRPDRYVLMVLVRPSAAAPHEIQTRDDPRIKVRRADKTVDAGIDDIERMIRRREQSLAMRPDPFSVQGLRGRLPGYNAPFVAVEVRPRRIPDYEILLTAATDRRVLEAARTHRLAGNDSEVQSTPHHALIRSGEMTQPPRLADVHEDGCILCIRRLQASPGTTEQALPNLLAFSDIANRIKDALDFAALVYAPIRYVGEVGASIGIDHIVNHELSFESTSPGDQPLVNRTGILERKFVFSVSQDGTLVDPLDSMLPVARWITRGFGASISDANLTTHLRMAGIGHADRSAPEAST